MQTLEDLYFHHDPRPHEEQLNVAGVTWAEGCPLRSGTALPLNEPCHIPHLWAPMCRVFLRGAAMAGHTDPALMSGLTQDTTYGHIA